jgi:hypothetical protein
MRFILPLLCVLLASGCAKGVDRSLITGDGVDKYRTSFQRAAEAMTEEALEAYNWAVSDFDIDRLHQTYPNATPRQIIRGEVKKGLSEWSAMLQELEESRAQYDAIIAELRKIEPREIRFELDRDFHGLQPRVHARIANRSQLDVSSLRWRASLFLDGSNVPAAVYDVFDNYNNAGVGRGFMDGKPASTPAGGMRSGYEYSRTFTIGFVTGDPNWITLAVQNAAQRVVVLEPLLESIKDFSDRAYLDGAPYERIRALEAAIESAKKYEHI